MKCSIARFLGVAAIYLLIHLGIAACSGSQGDEEGLDAENQGEENAEDGDQEANGTEEGGGGENLENANIGEGEAAPEESANAAPTAEGSSDGELQDIISSMNGQEAVPENASAAAGTAEAPANAATVANASSAAPAASSEAPADAAASTPAGNGLPETGSKMPYVVKRGDTLGTIAAKIYGDKSHWKEIASLSSLKNPSRIYPGDVVYYQLTQQTTSFASSYENSARKEVTVQQGDTLATIAKRVLGNSQEWKAIWRQNDTVDNPDKLKVGQTIYYVDAGGFASNMTKDRSVNVVSEQKPTNLNNINLDNIEKINVNSIQNSEISFTNSFFNDVLTVSTPVS